MLTFKANQSTNRKSFRRIMDSREGSRRAIRQFLFLQGKDMKAEAERAIAKGPHTGMVYRNVRLPGGRIKRRHRASAAGRSHADLSRRTKKSLGWKVHAAKSMDFGYGVAPQRKNPMPPHAPFLETGTRNMGARPTLLLAIRATQGNGNANWRAALKKEMGPG